jgi:hypothetical protein
MRSADEVFSLRQKLEMRDARLQRLYSEVLEEMGLTIEPTGTWAIYEIKRARKRQWWERQRDDEKTDMSVNVNRLHQIIEAQRTVIGATRSLRVPPPSPDDEGAAYASKLENAIRHLWREWVFPRQLSLMGWYAAIFGSAVAVVYWSSERSLPMLRIESPIGFYAVPRIDDPVELAEALFVRHVSGLSLTAEYPDLKDYGDADDVVVIDYYSSDGYARYVEGRNKPLVESDMNVGRTPVYVVPGILGPGMMGLSPMSLAIPIHRELQRLYSLEAEVLQMAVRAPTVINDPINVPENFAWGDDAVIEVGPQGRVGKAPLDNIDHNLFFHRIQDMRQNLDDVMDFTSMQRGEFEGSILTGKGVSQLLRPNAMRLEGRLQAIDPILERINEVALVMWRKYGSARGTVIYGRDNANRSFVERFNPKTDIDLGWVKNFVWLDTSSMFDRQSNIAQILTALRAGSPSQQAISQQRAIELLPFADDSQAELERIWNEWGKTNEFLQQQAQVPAPGSPTAEEQLAAAEKGGNPQGAEAQAGAPAGQAAPAEQAAPAGAPEEGNEVLVALAEFMRSIDRIKGRVFLCGEVLDGDLTYGIEIYITNPLDKQTIINAFANDQQLSQFAANRDLHFRETPADRMLEVTPGTSGYELVSGNEVAKEVNEGAEPESAGRPV